MTTPAGTSEYAYNAANKLVGLANKNAADAVLASYGTMQYLGTGDLATVTSTIPGATSLAGVVDYAYDRKRQLTLEDSDRAGGYDFANAFDGAGNATTFRDGAQTFSADHQLSGTGYVYDGNGNPTTFGGTTLAFDVENRLTAYGTALTAGYRGDSLRAWKETTAGRTYFLYDGIRIVCELDADGDLVAGSTYGAAGLLSRGTTQYQFDPLGDAVLLLDGSGAVTANRLFDAWGNELTAVAEPYGYRAQHGYWADGETGLVALAYRYYAPGVGRFVNRDPIRYDGGVNVYAYAGSLPSTQVDPSGLVTTCDECLPDFGRCLVYAATVGLLGPILKVVAFCAGAAALACAAASVIIPGCFWPCFRGIFRHCVLRKDPSLGLHMLASMLKALAAALVPCLLDYGYCRDHCVPSGGACGGTAH